MELRPLEPDDLETVAGWLAEEENYRWLDFGGGQQVLSAVSLAMMRQRDMHCLRVFNSDDDDHPAGIVVLSNVSSGFGSATLWYVLGDKAQSGRGLTSRAVAKILSVGFDELGLESVNAWAIESNTPSIRVLEKNGFTLIGRQRRCHKVAGELVDRLLFDLLVTEHRGLEH